MPSAGRRPQARPAHGRRHASRAVRPGLYQDLPLQVVQAKLFGMSQSSANEWIHFLLPVLAEALDTLGVLPEREAAQPPGRSAAEVRRLT